MAIKPPMYGSANNGEINRLTDAAAVGTQDLAHATGLQNQMYGNFGSLASGATSSMADTQMQAALARTQANSAALAGQTRGGNVAGAEQAAMIANFAGQSQGAADAAQVAAQQQVAAMQAQAGLAGQMAGQGLSVQQGYEGLANAANSTQMSNQVQSQIANREMDAAAKQAKINNIMNGIKTAASVAGSLGGAVMSDERVKRDVAPSGMAATHAVSQTDPITFNYEPGYGPTGQQVGISASSLERTPEGAQAVMTDPTTGLKSVDTGRLSTINTAALAEIVPRLEAIERGATMPARGPRDRRYDGRDSAAFPAQEQGAQERGQQLATDLRAAREARLGVQPVASPGEPGSQSLAAPQGGLAGLRARVEAMRSDPSRFQGIKALTSGSAELAGDPDPLLARRLGGGGQKPVPIRRPGTEGWLAAASGRPIVRNSGFHTNSTRDA